MAMSEYKLDPAFYVSSPSFSFDAMLLMTNIELDLIKDPTMYIFIELGLRGGVSSIFKRIATSNNIHNVNYDKRIDGQTLFYTGDVDCIFYLIIGNRDNME